MKNRHIVDVALLICVFVICFLWVIIFNLYTKEDIESKTTNELLTYEVNFYFQELTKSQVYDSIIWPIRDRINMLLLENLDNLSDEDCKRWILKLEQADSIYSHRKHY